MKKSKYIGKYDYLNYYTKQPAFWFYTNTEIQAAVATYLKFNSVEFNEDDEDYDNEKETDTYEYYKEQKELLKDVDLNDPNIIQGLLIDKASREFIIQTYPNFKMVDLESGEYKYKKQEDIAILTKDLLLNNENIVLFQPVFIHANLITKPDAVIKQGLEITIIETKGTTTAKLHHFLDLYFQYQVVSQLDYLEDNYFSMKLCLVKYCLANKCEVPFIITPYINLSKSISLVKVEKQDRGLIKTGEYFYCNKEMTLAPITIDNLCNNDLSELEYRAELSSSFQTKEWAKRISDLLFKTFNEFRTVIAKLIEHKSKMFSDDPLMITGINPHPNDKNPWKNPDLFALLKPLYIKQGFAIFKYSGNVINQNEKVLAHLNKETGFNQYFKNEIYLKLFTETTEAIVINKSLTKKLWYQLKPKKVYFDFETINTPIRPMDNCYPFMQIVTQCSIIKDHNRDNESITDTKCNNILVDPKNITIADFKTIVDSLYEGDQYSYIVYNASFERSRLKEIKDFINESEYDLKIDIIINNLFDLALFFIAKDKEFPILITELGGFYSIKKVLPFLEKNYPQIFIETGCKDYQSLSVKNGIVCQTETTKRFYETINDSEWFKLAADLKIYCENDVRAMVAIEYFLNTILVDFDNN